MKKVVIIIVVLGLLISGYLYKVYQDNVSKEKVITLINSKNKKEVITINDTKVYEFKDNNYTEVMTIYKDNIIKLDTNIEINENTLYLKLLDKNYYISYNDVVESSLKETKPLIDYSNLVPFNTIVTGNNITFYDNDKKLYSIKEYLELPIIKKKDDCYYVKYNNKVLQVKKTEVTTKESTTVYKIASNIPVLNYHFFWEGVNDCNQSICLSTTALKEQLEYIKAKGYYAATMEEFYSYLLGEINLPKNTILITIDDGWKAELGIKMFEEYGFNHTLFLMTKFYNPNDFYSLAPNHLEIHSHTDNLHFNSHCPGGQGSPLKCYPEDLIQEDLKLSREKLNNSMAFCFPFYEYNDYALDMIKKAGFSLSFIGGNRPATRDDDLYKIPRYRIATTTNITKIL